MQRAAARPVFASGTLGYATVDHFRIDPLLGDKDDFDTLIAAADQRAMRMILDGLLSHVKMSSGLVPTLPTQPSVAAGTWLADGSGDLGS